MEYARRRRRGKETEGPRVHLRGERMIKGKEGGKEEGGEKQ